MTHNRFVWIPLVLAALVAMLFYPRDSEACSGWEELLDVNEYTPDADPTAYVGGRLGLVSPYFRDSALVVAYRWLSGVGLDADEQRSALWVAASAQPPSDANVAPPASAVEQWRAAHREVLGVEAPAIDQGFVTDDAYAFGFANNCLDHAFVKASETLRARAHAHGVNADVRAWASTQNAVFANCDRGVPARVPAFLPLPTLPSTAPEWLAKDHAYQLAAAHFYAGDYAQAEELFTAIGNDANSEWASYGQYLAARAVARTGDLERADHMMARITASAGSPLSPRAIAGYRQHLAIRHDKAGAHAVLAAHMEHDHVGADFGSMLYDFVFTTAESDRDPIVVWIHNLADQSDQAYELALRNYESDHSQVWLVAALMHANSTSTRAAALVRAAQQLPRTAPAYVTARYHAARVLASMGEATRAYDMLEALRHELTREEGPSALNAVRLLAVTVAPSLDAFARDAFVAPIALRSDSSDAHRVPDGVVGLTRPAALRLATGMPLSLLSRLATSDAVPAEARPILVGDAYVRAALLNDRSVRTQLEHDIVRLVPASAPYVREIERATTEDARRLGVLDLLLHVPELGIAPPEHYNGVPAHEGIDTVYNSFGWATLPNDEDGPACSFLTRAEREARDREVATLRSFGASVNFIARELLRLAPRFQNDARIPEMLHLTVRLTRFGQEYDTASHLSRDVFRYLHRTYPNDPMTARTPFHY